jgi:hypothetical protein
MCEQAGYLMAVALPLSGRATDLLGMQQSPRHDTVSRAVQALQQAMDNPDFREFADKVSRLQDSHWQPHCAALEGHPFPPHTVTGMKLCNLPNMLETCTLLKDIVQQEWQCSDT